MAQCQCQTWEALRPEALPQLGLKLIVAHPDPPTEQAMLFFRGLQQGASPAPVLALLPGTCDAEHKRLVLDVAADFLLTPLREDELRLRAARILGAQSTELEQVQHALENEMGLSLLVGRDPAFLRAVQQVLLFRNSKAPVLITGETGTGKELVAHAIHFLSSRRNGPFTSLDCGTLPEHLVENELFGHRRGAYTDAHTDQKGLAAVAEGGTLFLDEIDALSPANQAKFLRFLQEGTYRALGSERIVQSNLRIIAATNQPIEEAVQERRFRSDLYFRLNVLRLELPPLRNRREDISLLANHFLERESPGRSEPKTFSACAVRMLESHDWPGNVRELLNTVQRAMICCRGSQIRGEDILLPRNPSGSRRELPAGATLRSAKQSVIERFEHDFIAELLTRYGGNVTRAAREAGKERRAFGRLMKKYGLGRVSGQNGSDSGAGPS